MSAEAATARQSLWPASVMHVTGLEGGAGTAGVVAAGYSGLEILGTVGGVLSGVAAIVALVLSVAAGNAKRRRQYDDDQRAAEARGRAAMVDELAAVRTERDEYRDRYLNMLESRDPRRATPPEHRVDG